MRLPSVLVALVPWILLLSSACSSNSPTDKNQGVTSVGGLAPGQPVENTGAETALSVGEWAYTDGGGAVKEYFWLCGGGHLAYRRDGDFSADASKKATFADVASGVARKGSFQIYGEDYVKAMALTLDGAATKTLDLVTDDVPSFTISEKRFLRTGRGCEFAYN